MLGLYESISALASKVNRLCCAVQQIQNNEGGSYLKYVALLTQSGEDDPVATVLENTLDGPVVWTRVDVGDYTGTLNGAFTLNKSVGFLGTIGPSDGINVAIVNNNNFDINSCNVQTYNSLGERDGVLDGTFIEIRVYP